MVSQTEKKMKSDGILLAIKALKEKLAELERRQNEREENRGFSEGGASVESSDKEGAEDAADITNQIAAMTEELEGFEEQAAEIAVQDDVVKAASEDSAPSENTDSISPTSDDLEAVAEQYRAWGIDCEVGVSQKGDPAIVVKNPGDFQGQNLLEMTSDNLDKMVSDIGHPGNSPQATEIKDMVKGQENSRGGATPSH